MEMRFWYCTEQFRMIWNKHNVYFSEKFCNYFSDNLKDIFYKEAGIKPSFKIGLSAFKPEDVEIMYEPGEVSRIYTAISILPAYTSNIIFCWESKSGKIVHTYDEDFEEEDLICWIEGIKAKEYWDNIGGENTEHPFKIKNLTYALKVFGFSVDMGLTVKTDDKNSFEEINYAVGAAMEKYIVKSEKKDGKLGFPHNYSTSTTETGDLLIRMDTGSAGVGIIKDILKALAKFKDIKEVVMDM
jgi:hypothetical protein